jgi:hypothetical protein
MREAIELPDEVKKRLMDLFERFMPKEVALDNYKQMAMYEAYHLIKGSAFTEQRAVETRNIKCQCKPDEKHGQTSVMCCNDCGLPDEDFWSNGIGAEKCTHDPNTCQVPFCGWPHRCNEGAGEAETEYLLSTEKNRDALKESMSQLEGKEDLRASEIIEDGFGSAWSKRCPTCGENTMQVVRPGKVQCSNCG